MRRAGCRGRTLVLKVKLHTYEVHTRQVAPPRSVCRADDLYRYALPMLARFEQEMPGLTLRLMGLRCTNLVSTQKPDTLAFFGLKPRRKSGGGGGAGSGSSSSNDHRGNDQSERRDADVHTGEEGDWEPGADEDELFGAYEGDVEMDQGLRDGGLTTGNDANTTITTASNTNNINNNNTNTNANGTPEPNEEWWDCPVCGRPQTADERRFNEHIDLCLSRQTIRDAVQQHSTPPPGVATATAHESQRPKAPAEKKRGRPAGSSGRAAAHDPRQKRLCFG
ncbi:hypothetical protein VTK73DRAFT_5678 [Phialemonium thermophilum]|uniref:UBZ4-type domain-containing protein n=1 Tax=Phialemonium thermophilum TaxID=223376 RepID=A0ABR3V0V7_9PEZI